MHLRRGRTSKTLYRGAPQAPSPFLQPGREHRASPPRRHHSTAPARRRRHWGRARPAAGGQGRAGLGRAEPGRARRRCQLGDSGGEAPGWLRQRPAGPRRLPPRLAPRTHGSGGTSPLSVGRGGVRKWEPGPPHRPRLAPPLLPGEPGALPARHRLLGARPGPARPGRGQPGCPEPGGAGGSLPCPAAGLRARSSGAERLVVCLLPVWPGVGWENGGKKYPTVQIRVRRLSRSCFAERVTHGTGAG